MLISMKGASCQRGRMRGFQDMMTPLIDQYFFIPGEIPPEQEDQAIFLLR